MTATLTFSDEFNSLNLWNGTGGTWSTTTAFVDDKGNGSSLPTNGEQEWYVNANYGPTASVKPWTVNDGVLTITAQKTDPSIAQYLGYNQSGLPAMGSYEYTSGLIETNHSFTQTYGYFEMSAELPAGKGLWPAFWLMPADGSWPPELDVMEVLGQDTTTLYNSVHSAAGGHTAVGGNPQVADMSNGFHTYGVDWEPDKITFYFDHKQVYQTDTPADMSKPMYMIANLAVGGYWPGSPDGSTQIPAEMKIDYIKAWTGNPYADGVSSTPATPDSSSGLQSAASATPTASTTGTSGDDAITGHADASNYMRGMEGNDQLTGGNAFDDINGNQGNDTIHGGAGADWVVGGQGDDLVFGDDGNDLVYGNLGNDTLQGGAGDDIVRGGQGDDYLMGGQGNDWLSGDRGHDTLTGGAGADTFHLSANGGVSIVTDFHATEGDRVQLDAGMHYSVAQSGDNTVISVDGGGYMVLQHVQATSLGSNWIFET